MLKKILILVG